jgi:hypothetical protein
VSGARSRACTSLFDNKGGGQEHPSLHVPLASKEVEFIELTLFCPPRCAGGPLLWMLGLSERAKGRQEAPMTGCEGENVVVLPDNDMPYTSPTHTILPYLMLSI